MGVEISIGWLTLIMFGSLLVLLMAGLPLAFVTGGLGCIFLFVFGNASMLNILPSRIFPFMTDFQLSAIPLFIFMATMLERVKKEEAISDLSTEFLAELMLRLMQSMLLSPEGVMNPSDEASVRKVADQCLRPLMAG